MPKQKKNKQKEEPQNAVVEQAKKEESIPKT